MSVTEPGPPDTGLSAQEMEAALFSLPTYTAGPLSPRALHHAATSADPTVRMLAAQHAQTHEADVIALIRDQVPWVRHAARRRPHLPQGVLVDCWGDQEFRTLVAATCLTLTDQQKQDLTTDLDVQIRRDVAMNPTLGPGHVALLAADRDWHVRAIIAQHHHLPAESAMALALDEDYRVRRNLKANTAADVAARVVAALKGGFD
jgi:hypothetical protein